MSRVEGYGGLLVMVDVLGQARQINIGMLDDDAQAALTPGDFVLIHMGFVVDVVDEAAAERAMSGLEMMGRSRAEADEQDAVLRDAIS